MGFTSRTIVFLLLHNFFFSGVQGYAQTNIGASIGIEFTKVMEVPNSTGFRILDSGYENKSVIGGLRIEQQLSESSFISLLGTYTEKKVNATDRGFIPFENLTYKKIDIAFTGNWIPVSTLSVGAGLSHNFVPSIKKVLRSGFKDKITRKRREFGLIINTSYLYKDFMVELFFYKGIKVLSPSNESNVIEPSNSMGISLSYIFRVFENRNKKSKKKKRI